MKQFTRFETQYILMLAVRAREELKKEKEGQTGYIDPNIDSYIDALEEIAYKAKDNLKEYDKNEKL